MNTYNNSCFFKTMPTENYAKALIQITERCNLNCIHCFLNATNSGTDISFDNICSIIPKLKNLNVNKVTITGGEPLLHENIFEICKEFVDNGFTVTICTNGTLITDNLIIKLRSIKNIKFNISIDGFSKLTVENFRGHKDIFENLILSIKKLSSSDLLKGLITTPNTFANYSEYSELCIFAKNLGVNSVIINPLSKFGRGIKSKDRIAPTFEINKKIKAETYSLIDDIFDITYIRLNTNNSPLGKCNASKLFYILANGDVYNCPYIFFAASNPKSKYITKDFLLGNIIFDDSFDICSNSLRSFFNMNSSRNDYCSTCKLSDTCAFGCPAMIISEGQFLNGVDNSICPNPTHF